MYYLAAVVVVVLLLCEIFSLHLSFHSSQSVASEAENVDMMNSWQGIHTFFFLSGLLVIGRFHFPPS